MEKNLTKSLETYLVAIDSLLKENKSIIVKDVAKFLGFSGISTSDAIKKLRETGYVNYVAYGNITLTELGEKVVLLKKNRINIILKFFTKVLNIEEKKAKYNADKIEYFMTNDVLNRFINFLNFMEKCSCSNPKWLKSCKLTLETGFLTEKCNSCKKENKNCCINK